MARIAERTNPHLLCDQEGNTPVQQWPARQRDCLQTGLKSSRCREMPPGQMRSANW